MKKAIHILLVFAMLLSVFAVVPASVQAAGESRWDGYTPISTKEQLNNIRNDLDGKFYLVNDIVFTDADFQEGGAFYNKGMGWTAIKGFTGILDGNYHVIKGLKISIRYTNSLFANANVGLFATAKDAIIFNLGLENVNISGTAAGSGKDDYLVVASVGGIVGEATNCEIHNCYVSGSVKGKGDGPWGMATAYVGGIVGNNLNTRVTNCANYSNVSSYTYGYFKYDSINFVGGICGTNGKDGDKAASISNCHNGGEIYAYGEQETGMMCAGGIVGWTYSNIYHCSNTNWVNNVGNTEMIASGGICGAGQLIMNSYNTANIGATSECSADSSFCYSGGIAGVSQAGINGCFNTGDAGTHPKYKVCIGLAGGLAGYVTGSGSPVKNSYSTGKGWSNYTNQYEAGLVALNATSNVGNLYYSDRSDKGTCSKQEIGVRCTDAQMRQQATYAGFDFTNMWTMKGSSSFAYPELQFTPMWKPGWVKGGDTWYYFDANAMAHFGWQKIDGVWYYFNAMGAAAIGLTEIDGQWYYMDENCQMIANKWKLIDDIWYYFRNDGAMATGWQQINGVYYFFNENGVMHTGWLEQGGVKYYMKEDGAMTVGWKKLDGVWYYFKADGAMATGWVKVDGVWYYMAEDGTQVTGWIEYNGDWYYCDEDGYMAVGWRKLNGKWYYFKSEGAMATGWVKVDGVWYYMAEDGTQVTGWISYNGYWYYCDQDGYMSVGWDYLGGYWYYFETSGEMLCNTSREIGGKVYFFDENGHCTNP